MSLLNRPSTQEVRAREITDVLVGTSVAGFGFSLGRDAYRKLTENWFLLTVLTAGFFGTAYAGWNTVRGHDDENKVTSLGRNALAVFLIILGLGTTYALSRLFVTQDHRQAIEIAAIVQIVSACAGILIGAAQRPARLQSFEVRRHNRAFLTQAGLREVGGSFGTVLDRYGNELTLEDVRDDRLVLRLLRSRDAFGYIDLDETGRMIAYHPPVA